MTAVLVEAGVAVRRLARRRILPVTGVLVALFLGYAAVLHPVASARTALAAATAVATLVLLFTSAAIVADDRERGRLVIVATHPAPPSVWVVGRWLAVTSVAALTLAAASAVLLPVAGGPLRAGAVALAELTSVAHLAALGALAVALSCAGGSTPQVLILVALCAIGAMAPDVVAQPLGSAWAGLLRVVWTALPTVWALDRLHAWSFAAGAPVPALALVLVLQPALWLGAGARRLARAELAVRGA